MRFRALVVLIATAALAQNPPQIAPQPQGKSTVPITLDHNRVVIDVDLSLPDGSTKRVRGWVDSGSPDLYLSRRAAMLMGLAVTCGEKICSAPTPREITIGSMTIPLAGVKEAKIPLKPVAATAVMFPGLNAEVTIPSTLLRNYDVLINFPDRELTLAQPGSLKFNGVKAKAIVNLENGLIQVASQIENKKYNLALDLGASISLISGELFDKLAADHPAWPHMTGAIGPANMWGTESEKSQKLVRIERLQYGPLYLTDVAAGWVPGQMVLPPEKHALPVAGSLGSDALINYRIGLDYAHSTVYFDIGRLFNFPEFDVIGVILRPEDDGRFTVLGIADYDGKPSVPQGQDGVQAGDHLIAVDGIPVLGSTMGQVWSMLRGAAGKERKLTVERGGEQFIVVAKVQHFLNEASEQNQAKGGSSKEK
jgi:hypothetical protein